MTTPAQPSLPICKRCGRLLRTDEEREQAYCSRCPPPAAPSADEDERFCCAS